MRSVEAEVDGRRRTVVEAAARAGASRIVRLSSTVARRANAAVQSCRSRSTSARPGASPSEQRKASARTCSPVRRASTRSTLRCSVALPPCTPSLGWNEAI